MRLSVFLLLALVISLGVGVIAGLSGAGIWASLTRAIVVLVVLQVAYFLFLVFASRGGDKTKLGQNHD